MASSLPLTPNPSVGSPEAGPVANPTPQGVTAPDRPNLLDDWRGFLKRPDVQQGLLQFGASVLQPRTAGQSTAGIAAESLVKGMNATATQQAREQEVAQQDFQNSIARRGLETTEARTAAINKSTDANIVAQEAATARAAEELKLAQQEASDLKDYRQASLGLEGARLELAKISAGNEAETARWQRKMAEDAVKVAADNKQWELKKWAFEQAAGMAKADQKAYTDSVAKIFEGAGEAYGLKFLDKPDELANKLGDLVAKYKPAPIDPNAKMQTLFGQSLAPTAAPGTADPGTPDPVTQMLSSPEMQAKIQEQAKVLGLTPEEVAADIEAKLRNKAAGK